MAVFGVVELVQMSVEHASRSQLALEARALALSGVALGTNSQLQKGDPIFTQSPAAGHQFSVNIESEGARLNLNYVLLSGHREILVNLFTHWGLHQAEADHVADCLYDWVTPGDLRSLNGAKAADYAQLNLPQRPTYQAFATMDEVKQVLGMDLLEKAKPNWEDSFTLWSEGPLNINEAPGELIAAVFGIDPSRVKMFINARNGKDQIVGTQDDVPVQDPNALQVQLGLSPLLMQTLGKEVSLRDGSRRIESVGQANGVQVMISVVVRFNNSPLQYFLWSEQ